MYLNSNFVPPPKNQLIGTTPISKTAAFPSNNNNPNSSFNNGGYSKKY